MSKEVYEAGDEVDFEEINKQHLKGMVDTRPQKANENIESVKVSASDAYSAFRKAEQGHPLTTSHGKGLQYYETPSEKLARLRSEVAAFEQEMQDYVKKEEEVKIANVEAERNQLDEIKNLQTNLNKILDHPDFKQILNASTLDENSKSQAFEISAQVRNQAAEAMISKLQVMSKGQQGDANVTYKLHLDKKGMELKQQMKFEDLEHRLSNLEKVLGTANSDDDFISRMDKIEKVTDVLVDEEKIDLFTRRLSSVINELDTLNAKKQVVNVDSRHLEKLDQLYDNFKKVQPISEELPQIIDRLECLKLIHEESATISDKFKTLKDLQSNLASKLTENKDVLTSVSQNFVSNIEAMNKNIQGLEERIKKL